MMRRALLALGSSRVRLALGMLLACLLMTQIISTFEGNQLTASPQASATVLDPDGKLAVSRRIEHLARTDHVQLLKEALGHYHRSYRDYTCTLTKQERLAGEMSKVQVIDVRFKEDPFSVLMTWQVNATRGDKMLYIENDPAGDHRMYIHPTGLAGRLIRSVARQPDDPEVLRSSLRSIKEFGFARGMQALIDVYEKSEARGHLIEASYAGTGKVDGRPTIALKRVLPAGHNYPAKVTIIEIDQEYLVPVHIKGTDWQDRNLCDYTYTNVKFNTGLKDSDFTRGATGL